MIAPESATQSKTQNPESRIGLNDLLRATFLASSWTWVIGMFLPVLLVREWGVWAWVIFAIPNCVGAAAMGWTIRTREQSRQLVAAHDIACRAFSLVTIAFHVFFLAWLIVPWMNWRGWLPGAFVFVFAFLTMRTSGVGLAALLTYIYSLICAALFVHDAGVNIVSRDAIPQPQLIAALVALIPVCVFGFALDPYLDLTFHAARQASDDRRGAKIAFGLGFCVLFCAMIVFTLIYSGILWRDILGSSVDNYRPPSAASAVWFVAGHILFQAAFTAGVHTASVTGFNSGRKACVTTRWIGVLVAIVVGITAAGWARLDVYRHDMLAGELVYRLFMASYALIFPTYAWVCMAPTWRNPQPPTGRQLVVFAVAVLLATPFFWLAFIDQKMPWGVVGVAIALLARFVNFPGRRQSLDTA